MSKFLPDLELIEKIEFSDPRIRDPKNFFCGYDAPRKPVLITGATDGWKCRNWSLESFEERFGDAVAWSARHVEVSDDDGGELELTMQQYSNYLKVQKDENPLYIFDSDFGANAPELLKEYDPTIGGLFKDDFLAVAFEGKERPPFRWVVVGPERSGASWHIDPAGTSAWNLLTSGRKRWAFYPPGKVPPGAHALFSEDDAECLRYRGDNLRTNDSELLDFESPDSVRWYLDVYPSLSLEDRPLEIVQKPGDVVFVPAGWWHMVLNLDTTVSVTQNFVNRANFNIAMHSLASSGFPISSISKFVTKLVPLCPERDIDHYRYTVMMLESGASDRHEYMESLSYPEVWSENIDRIIAYHGLKKAADEDMEYVSLDGHQNAIFSIVPGNALVKFFPHFLRDTGPSALRIESALPLNGADNAQVESTILRLLENVPELLGVVPRLFGSGQYYGVGHEIPWSWPYIIMSKVPGRSLSDESKDIKSSSQRWKYIQSLYEIASDLGQIVKSIHDYGRRDPNVLRQIEDSRTLSLAEQIRFQKQHALASHWRDAVVPRHLLMQMEAFIDTWMPVVMSRLQPENEIITLLHGDLQDSNILVVDAYNDVDDAEATRRTLFDSWRYCAHGDISELIDRLVRKMGLRIRNLIDLSTFDMDAYEIPKTLQASLVRRLSGTDGEITLLKQDKRLHFGGIKFRGIVDFADGLVGDPIYDFVALHVGVCRGRKDLLKRFIASYESTSSCLDPTGIICGVSKGEFAKLALCHTILHPCEVLKCAFEFQDSLFQCASLDEVADILWGL